MPIEEPIVKCQYCDKEIKENDTVTINPQLHGIFGYIYCSQECYDVHLASK